MAWAHAEVLIELKLDPKHFPFASRHTPRSPFLPTSRARRLSRGQLALYAGMLLAHQPRAAAFIISAVRDRARLIRFDRAGARVSEEFDYIARPDVLGTFLARFAHGRPAERGRDPTAVLAGIQEVEMFRSLWRRFPVGSAKAQGLRHAASGGWAVYKLAVNAPFSQGKGAVARGTPPSRRVYLVGRPASMDYSLISSGTKVFIAYDVETGDVVTLKDTWRQPQDGTQSEVETYLQLNEGTTGELYIPTLLGGGDVLNEGELQHTSPSSDLPAPRIHSRLVFKEVCRPLEEFANSFELVKVVTWAVVGTYKLFVRRRSPTNISCNSSLEGVATM